MRKRSSIICGILVLAVVCSACAKEEIVYLDSVVTESEMTEAVTPDVVDEPAFCCVYVCGAVRKPGVYRLAVDARVCDAIEAAGGFEQEAAQESVNLAGHIRDEQQIWIPTAEEAEAGASPSYEDVQPERTAEGISSDGRVNLNTATKSELMSVPGIGEAKAESIIAYRTEHGSFSDIQDIMQITGIKEGIFEKIKDSITVN